MKRPKFIAEPTGIDGCWTVKRFNEVTKQYEFCLCKGVCLSELEAKELASFKNSLSEETDA